MEIRTCKRCGFILNTRPRMKVVDGVCLSCINEESKKTIDFKARQEWLTKYIQENRTHERYDCLVAVSGGKDSCMIVRRLIENHGVKNPLLVSVTDEFTHSQAGMYNIDNLVKTYNLDLMTFRCQPKTFAEETKKDFMEELYPLKWIEERIYSIPLEVARNYGIRLVFFGENSAYEYGESTEPEIFHTASDEDVKMIFMGMIYPYSNTDSLKVAREIGFKTLSDFTDWERQGSVDDYTQIDSVGYMVHHWMKFIKFGFQRASDLSARFVREGVFTKEQAELYIKERDYICDPAAKKDFCRCIGITEEEFHAVVDKFANQDLLVKDANGNWRRRDLI